MEPSTLTKNLEQIKAFISNNYQNIKKLGNKGFEFFKSSPVIIFFHQLWLDINRLEEKNLKLFKSIVFRVICIIAGIWAFILFIGLFFTQFTYENVTDKTATEVFGQLGDAMNIVTSLTGVLTVGLLAYAIYLQKTELSDVKNQIKKQTESTEKEQKMNRTLKYLEEWETSWNSYQKSGQKSLILDQVSLYPDVFNFLENLMAFNQIKQIEDKYIDIPLIVTAIDMSCLLPEINKTVDEIDISIGYLKKPTGIDPKYSGIEYGGRKVVDPDARKQIEVYEKLKSELICYKDFIYENSIEQGY